MKQNLIVILFFAQLVFSACDGHRSLSPKQLAGAWQSEGFRIRFESYRGKDSAFTLHVSKHTWKQKMGIRPTETVYRDNGSYTSRNYSLNDSLLFEAAGRWIIQGDTLVLQDTFPSVSAPFKYHVAVKGHRMDMASLEDAEGDGMRDDEYFAVLRKIQALH